MKLITGRDQVCADIAEALGIKNCRRLDIHMEVDEKVTVTTEFYPERDQVKQIAPILKKYGIGLVEIK